MNGISAAFLGLVGGEPMIQCTKDGDAMISFSVLVVDHLVRTGGPRLWVRCAAFGQLAEQLDGVLCRGDHVACEGRLVVKIYEGAPDIEVYCWDVQALPGPPAPRHMPKQASGAAGSPRRARR